MQPKIVVIGGGGGSAQVLKGLMPHTPHLTGVITVTDTGRSTGKARTLGDMAAPGDLRNVIGLLAPEGSLLPDLIQFRFKAPGDVLDGMALGNLMMVALKQMTGDFAQAVELLRQLAGVSVQIYPVTDANTHLCAELEDGTRAEMELNVRGLNKPRIKRLYLQDPAACAYPPVLDAIKEADLVVMGPGSLFTTVLACLVFPDLSAAIRESKAKSVFICNTTQQPGQTDQLTVYDHVQQVTRYLGDGVLDAVVINSTVPSAELLEAYARDGLHMLRIDEAQVQAIEADLKVKPLVMDIAEVTTGKRELWNKQDTIRHDSAKLAALLMELATQ